jgi:hypothetical protein
VERALGVLPPQGDYNTDWLPILMAVHDAFPDERGIALIERWSPGYKGEVARKWRSFETAERANRITIASLFHRAKQYGYTTRGKAEYHTTAPVRSRYERAGIPQSQ